MATSVIDLSVAAARLGVRCLYRAWLALRWPLRTIRKCRPIGRLSSWFLNQPQWDVRGEEYEHSIRFLAGCENVLDIACGTGTFLDVWPGSGTGIDINPDNVEFCKARGLDVRSGSALELPFPDNSFDGVHASHLMQVFQPDEAATFMREVCRVARDGGVVVITTLNWFPRFFRHPENARPYPPDAIMRYALLQAGATSPMYPGMPAFTQEAIWFRRPPFVELLSVRSRNLNNWFSVLNSMQLRFGLRKFWSYDAYTIKLKVRKH